MDNCVFCKILKGELPCHKIAENEYAIAFLDVSNDAYGHTLVVPKTHCENVVDCSLGVYNGVMALVKRVAEHYVQDCGFGGVNIINNTGACSGQTVMHLHIHVIPRKEKDGVKVQLGAKRNKKTLQEVCDALSIKDETIIESKKVVVLYTDGACSNNPGVGGYCSILRYNGREKIISGGEENTTNNRMELMGVLKGLQSIKTGCNVEVYSDSAYVVNAFENNWIETWQRNNWRTSAKTPVLNLDLWKLLLEETDRLKVKWCKVKGHADNELNNRCDEIARNEVQKIKDAKGE